MGKKYSYFCKACSVKCVKSLFHLGSMAFLEWQPFNRALNKVQKEYLDFWIMQPERWNYWIVQRQVWKFDLGIQPYTELT